MGIDLQLLQAEKGGDLQSVITSQQRRGDTSNLVNDVLQLYRDWTKGAPVPHCPADRAVQFNKAQVQREVNTVQKAIGAKMKVRLRGARPPR